jgi:hypothetical protein
MRTEASIRERACVADLAEHLSSSPPENSCLDTTATNSAAFFYRIRVE